MDDAKTSEQHSAGGPGSVAMSVNDSIYPAPIDQEYFLLDLPTDRPRSLQRSTAGSLWPIHIEKQRMLALLAIARENSVDLNVVLLSAWIAVLSRLSGQSELAVAVQGFSKNLEIKGADAYMYSSICADLSGDPSAERLFDLIKGAVLGLSAPRRLRQNDLCTLHQASFTWYDKRHCSSADDMGHSSSSAIHVGFDVELHLQVVDEQIVGAMQFATALFDPFTIERHVGYLQSMLDGVVSNADQRVSKISVLSPVERMLLLDTWNSTPATNQEFPTLHKLFEEQVKRTPKAIALVYEDQAMTYAELNERSNGVAHQLIELGVRPDTCVAICAGRSIGMVVGVLAILKSGGAYVPLDPAHVSERLLDILAEVSPLVVLADSVGRDIIQEADLPSIKIIDPNVPYKGSTANPCVPSLSTRHLAYVIYTSGSTGKPKGVMIEHRQVTRLFSATEDWFDFKEFDTWCLFHSFAFDVSVWEMWGALQSGGKLVIIPQDIARSPQDLYRLVCELGVTVLNLTPSAFKPIIECHTRDGIRDSLRYVILAGEALATAMLQPWYLTHTRDSPQVVNMYGPTETAIYATYRLISPEDCLQHSSPIGVRLPDVRTYVLDEHAQPVPLGAVGELYVGGAGVARGYLNRPQLTAERFLLDPFVDQPEGHMYRTGDLVKYLEDGSLVYLGRNDHQVKIRGFRIELGEIEARLAEHPAVSEAAVVALDDQAEKQLVAYVVTRAEDQSKKILEECQSSSADQLALTLRSHLMKRLPEYMVPAFFVHMDMLPLNPNGKLDRNALLAPGELHYARQMYEAPRGRIERTLAALWSNLLHVEHVSRHDNFFALGGHSLLATKVLEHLRRTGLTVSVRALFECPTLHALARAVEDYKYVIIPSNLIAQHSKSLTPEMLPLVDLNQADIDSIIDKIPGGLSNIQDIYSLSPLQEGILFHHLLATNGDPYLLTSTVAFESRALLDRYLTAFQTVVNRHDILRTSFFWENISTSAQVVCRKADLPIEELRLDADNGDIAHQLDKRFNPRHYRIDLCQAPLLRFIIAKNTDNRWLLVQLVHHLIGDHDSLDKMQNEIKSLLDGHDEQLPQPRSFRDHLAQIRLRTSPEADEMFFRGMLADLGEPTLPFGLTKVEDGGTDIMESHQILSQDLNDRLRLQAKQLRVSLATLCHVAWAQVLARTSGQRQVVFGTLLFGRLQAGDGSGHALGLSMSTLPFRCDVDERTVLKCVMDTQLHLTALLEHEHASLVLAQRCSKLPAGTPLFSGLLNYRHSSPPSINISGASEVEFVSQDGWFEYPGIQVLSSQQRTNYPFTLAVDDFGVALSLTAQVVHPFDPSRICGYMRKALEGLVEALESAGDIPIHTLDVLPDNERELLLKTWNGNPMDYPHQLCLQTLFEHQVERTPDAIALVYEDQSLSYDELNIRANRLAHRLVQLGVKPDTLVAICVERSPAMIIGILAILKAGGAYVPLDPFYASERLRDILLDAAPNIIVADSAGRNVLGDASLSNIMVVEPDVRDHSVSSSNPHIERLTSRHLAYVIYTSGSTGKPKGVLVEHVGVVNFVQCMQEVLQVGSSSHCTQFLSVSFDASANEIFNAVCYGGCLHLLQDSVRLDRERMWDYLQRHTVTHAILTPTLLQQCQDMPALRSLRTVTVTGEAMPPSLPQVLRKIAPNSTIINGYGPTECCIGTTLWQCTPDYCGDIAPIGRPISYKTIYLIDGHGKPVPLGAVGEIFIGGVGVARGYLNRPELTADRFLPDPFTFRSEAQMYKTGDLARYLPDGNLLYMGRNDDQIKIRGFRVELGEIEARLSEHNTVSEAVVIALGEGSYKRLVAYVIVKQGTQLERFKDAAEGWWHVCVN
ncbi:hypothetical protein BGX28_008649 [Mortierella sp. GBA30]|nr:hypothetical protein BGX28_008649 [Mortierella sp. GBA30]